MQDVIALFIVALAALLLCRPLWRGRSGGACEGCEHKHKHKPSQR
jgi:hypothetical protein